MARKSQQAKEDEPLTPQELEELEELDVFVQKFGATAKKVSVYRYNEDTGDPEFLKAAAPNLVNEEWLQRLGAGRYLLILRNDRGQFLKSRTVAIAKDGNTPAAPATSPVADHQLNLLREQMAHERAMTLKLIEGIAGNRGPSMAELMQSLLTMKQFVMPEGTKLAGGLKDGLELFSLFKDLFSDRDGGSGGDWKTELVKTAREALPYMVPAAPAVNPPAATERTPDNETAGGPTMATVLLKKGIDYLKPKVLRNSDPLLWRDFILENTEEARNQAFIRQVMSYPFEKFVELDSELGQEPYKTWFETLYLELKHALSNVDDSERPAGNDRDTEGDAKSDPAVDRRTEDARNGA